MPRRSAKAFALRLGRPTKPLLQVPASASAAPRLSGPWSAKASAERDPAKLSPSEISGSATIEQWFSFRTAVRNAPRHAASTSCAPPPQCFAPAASAPPACATSPSPPTCRPATCITTSAARKSCSSSARTAHWTAFSTPWPPRARPVRRIGARWRRAFASSPSRTYFVLLMASKGPPLTSRLTPCHRRFASGSSPSAIATSAACAPSSQRRVAAAPIRPSPPARFSARSTGRLTGFVPTARSRRSASPSSSPTMPSLD